MKRRPRVSKGELHVYHGVFERGESPDVIFHSGEGVNRRDRALLYCVFSMKRLAANGDYDPSFVDDLEERGYDLSTLRFSIRKREVA